MFAAVDPDPIEQRNDALNARRIEMAAFLAGREGSELPIVHACRLVTERMFVIRAGPDSDEAENLSRTVRNSHEQWIGKPAEDAAGWIHVLSNGAASRSRPC